MQPTGATRKWTNYLTKVMAESDLTKREEIYKQIQQLIFDAHPEAWMTEDPFNIVAHSYVKGYIYNPALHQALDVYNMQLDGKP